MLIISEIDLGPQCNPDLEIHQIKKNELKKYEGRPVTVIICSRKTAIEAANLIFPELILIQLTSAGFDEVPLDFFTKKGVKVANVSGVYGITIAETVVFVMLEIAKKVRNNPENRWPRLTRGYDNFITELYGKTAVILGIGNIGTETAIRLKGFGIRVIGYARHKKEASCFDEIITDRQELLKWLCEADFLISTLPGNDESKGFVSSDLIGGLKKTSCFINVGRRSTIDETALYKALKEKRIMGAVLDMFEKLPNPITNKFHRLSNTIVLPGTAAISKETNKRLKEYILFNLQALAKGKESGIVNREG